MEYNEKNILAIDCATSELKLGLQFGGDRIVKSTVPAEQSHSALIMRSIASLMQSANSKPKDLNAIVVATGPGSFTGLRIGIACTKGMAIALGIPVVEVNLFEMAAYKLVSEIGEIQVLVPFKKDSYFLGKIESGKADISSIAAVEISELQKYLNGSLVAIMGGPGPESLAKDNRLLDFSRTNYDATELIQIGIEKLNRNEIADLKKLEPLYVQKSQAEIRFEKRQSGQN